MGERERRRRRSEVATEKLNYLALHWPVRSCHLSSSLSQKRSETRVEEAKATADEKRERERR